MAHWIRRRDLAAWASTAKGLEPLRICMALLHTLVGLALSRPPSLLLICFRRIPLGLEHRIRVFQFHWAHNLTYIGFWMEDGFDMG